jgi:hypothetical protein
MAGLTHLAVEQDFAAKVLCDNLAAMFTSAARTTHKVLIPALLLGRVCVAVLQNVVKRISAQNFKHRPGLSRPRPDRSKPHKYMGYRAC